MRTIAIGDIHGCSAALKRLLAAVEPTSEDTLIFLGDYVDRGPDSRAVLEILSTLAAPSRNVFLRGNHDSIMQLWCEGQVDQAMWDMIGGAATLASYDFCQPSEVPRHHLKFLEECVNYFETETHIFVHANYHANMPIATTDQETRLWSHLMWPLPKPHCSGKTVVVGHTPQTNGNVADFGHLVCLDTFCFGGGYLTAYDVDRRTALQVDLHGKIVRNWNGVPKGNWLSKLTTRWFIPLGKTTSEHQLATH